ncbi:hypothetical protein JCM10212_005430 [Sporobolomyces blumeae]
MSSTPDLAEIRRIAIARTQYLIVWLAVLLWEYLATVASEYRHVWKAKRRWTVMRTAFLLNRYGTLLLFPISVATSLKPMSVEMCARLYPVQLFTVVWVTLTCHSILVIRLVAIYERQRAVLYCFGALLLAEFGLAAAASCQFEPINIPQELARYLELEGCSICPRAGAFKDIVLVFTMCPVVFDSVVIVAMIGRHVYLTRIVGSQLPLLRRLVLEGILYYIPITISHIITTVLWFNPNMAIRSFNVPASLVLGSVSCSRLVLSLLDSPPAEPKLTGVIDEAGLDRSPSSRGGGKKRTAIPKPGSKRHRHRPDSRLVRSDSVLDTGSNTVVGSAPHAVFSLNLPATHEVVEVHLSKDPMTVRG